MTTITIAAPGKYIQGSGELARIHKHVSWLGSSFFAIADDYVMNMVRAPLKESFNNKDCGLYFELFDGECTFAEIERLNEKLKNQQCDVVIGIGGGKTLDTAKAIAFYNKIPVAIVPTIASTDAPCSSLSVIYTEEGVFVKDLFLPKNPDVVLVDSNIIANAPVRLLVAGMGDALATFFEARACKRSNANNFVGGKATNAAFAMAKVCFDILIADGLHAKLAVENRIINKALENVIEANIYLSGVGFESNGCATAHAVYNGFTTLKRKHTYYHGEGVAFGTLIQLVLENSPKEELEKVLGFYEEIGLPLTLEDLGIKDISSDELAHVTEAICTKGGIVHNMPFDVTPADVYGAILCADAVGERFKDRSR